MIISKENVKLAARILSPHHAKLALLLFFTSLQAALFSALDPLAMKFLIDALSAGNMETFIWLAVVVTLIATVGRVVMYFSSIIGQQIKNTIHQQLTLHMTKVLYRKSYQDIATNGRGYYVARLHDEARQLSSMVDICSAVVSSVLVFIVGLSVAIWLSWEITATLAIIAPVLYFLAHRFSRRISVCTERLFETEAQFKSILNRAIDSFKYVKTHALTDLAEVKIAKGLQEPLDARYATTKVATMYQSVSSVFLSYAELSVLIAAGVQVILGAITIGSLFALTRAFSMIVAAIQQMSSLVPQLASLNGLLDRYKQFIAEEELIDVRKKTLEHSSFMLDQVSFKYGDKHILDNVSMRINQLDKVLISGGNGVGKSTLINLLAGFYQPADGQLTMPEDGAISAALYPFQLLPGTVRDNLTELGVKWGVEERAVALINELGLAECLDVDYDNLSEGQKKKCQIATCLMKPAELYIFDEPLANIDDNSKKRIMGIIEKYTTESALMMILHEGDTFKDHFNRFINLKGYGVVELV